MKGFNVVVTLFSLKYFFHAGTHRSMVTYKCIVQGSGLLPHTTLCCPCSERLPVAGTGCFPIDY